MTRFPLLCGAVAAVLHPLPSQAGTGADGWRLDCRGGLEAPVCRALAETLALRVGTVYLAGDAPEGTPTLRFSSILATSGPKQGCCARGSSGRDGSRPDRNRPAPPA